VNIIAEGPESTPLLNYMVVIALSPLKVGFGDDRKVKNLAIGYIRGVLPVLLKSLSKSSEKKLKV
jgi:hypothetical protein